MTVAQLRNLLASLPRRFDDSPVFFVHAGVPHCLNVAIVVPHLEDDANSPRVEFRQSPEEIRRVDPRHAFYMPGIVIT